MTDALQERLEQIWHRQESVVLERITLLECAAINPSPEHLAEAAMAAHKLAGSLGMFGRHRAGEAAAEAEALLAREGNPASSRALLELVARMRGALRPDAGLMVKTRRTAH